MSVWALLTADKRLEVEVDICALLRDVEVTGEFVGELPTRLGDGALETQMGVNTVAAYILKPTWRHIADIRVESVADLADTELNKVTSK